MSLVIPPQMQTDPIWWAFPFSQVAWAITPPTVQDYIRNQQKHIDQLQTQVDTLQGRLATTSQTSSKPPSSDSPFKKTKRQPRQSGGKRGARKGHPGKGPTLLSPTEVHLIEPGPCACGQGQLVSPEPYYTHQVIELPPIEMDIHHFILHQGTCGGCGQTLKAQVPSEHQAGYGPRLSALIGELGGMHRTSRRLMQDFCHSVLRIPMSLGTLQKVIDRVSQAILPHYDAIATLARQAPVGYIDETPWYCQNALNWLWTLSTETVSLSLIHPNRSKDAFFALIEQWQGLLVSDGYGVYQHWVHGRQTCLAHLIRTARGLSEKSDPHLAACGTWALKELQTLCHMAKAPPTGGQWRAWYARFCHLIDRYHERSDDAGRLTRRLQREMVSLWVFLREHGVEPTNNRAERALRFAVMWRKGSSGTESEHGNRWVERTLSLRQTCRQLGQSTYGVLVDALTSSFQGRQPDLAWLY
ncbi:MAG: IS66 family transposase [Gemmatimonadales bacterium]